MVDASAGPAMRRVARKKIAPADNPAEYGHPTCTRYIATYSQAQNPRDGFVRMKPVKAGSPVASVYRMSSVLKIVWKNTATSVIQSSDRP